VDRTTHSWSPPPGGGAGNFLESGSIELSIVTSLYHSAPFVDEFYRRIRDALCGITASYEVIFVDDGSPDDSLQRVLRLMDEDHRIVAIDLARNFGQHKAVLTGLEHARGRFVFLIDCDLELEPEVVLDFWRRIQANPDVEAFHGVQIERKGTWVERVTGEIFYRSMDYLSGLRLPRNLVTVSMMTSRYIRSLVAHRERSVFLCGLMHITGYAQELVPVQKRRKGSTTYSSAKKLSLFVDAIASFSNRPLKLIFQLGMAISVLALAAIVAIVVAKLAVPRAVSGWYSIIASVWFLGGLTISSLGVIGIYLSKVFIEVKQRPYTIIREIHRRDSLGETLQQVPPARGQTATSEHGGVRVDLT
jgi:putative glycosyltransferase